ncbi:hypothetical protein QWY85_04435 [Neolewinella lacunae]|uniref:Uncharacterized protein n=1 Tax=Neolewinella lacunae TaxID=1517758 RepID=A0A923TAS3_9BACT|nr:hypothetical protein [Neolewinella lacunae]MBC6996774.1 hypothetical protein [Neolewinella lacunae]MDN3633894.1 hypothetical protein [Neolewinella lacunae]
MHEAIHGYIDYFRATLSQSEFQIKFPLFAPGGILDAEHETMANNYINNLRAVIEGQNDSIADFMVDLMAWSGLQETAAYGAWRNSMPYGLSSEDIQASMNTFLHAASDNCGNGLPDGDSLGDFNFEPCN